MNFHNLHKWIKIIIVVYHVPMYQHVYYKNQLHVH